MNLVLHGLFFQVIVSIVQFQYGSTLCSAGEPGYLDFDNLPETNFSCQGKVIGGYYADVEAGCQMFHVCTIGQKDEIMDIKFLCLNGTVFDQETRVCERVDEVDCSKSERFYNLNLELYGNNAVTLSLHDLNPDDEDDGSEVIEESHESQRTTSSRPSTTSTTTTTTQRPLVSSTTPASGTYQHPNGYPQHYQPQPRFPPSQTSQSKSLYDDKNGGYHHQYIYHTGDHRANNLENTNDAASSANNQNPSPNSNGNNNNNNNNQATSYQLFSNQGVGSTTGSPQGHQIRYSSTAGPQIQIRNDHQPTVAPIFHATSSTIQTLLNSNANSPALINPIFHNHGIASTTEQQFDVHNNNPRETDEYRDSDEGDNENEESQDDRRPLEPLQPTDQGKISKLKISPISVQQESLRNGSPNKDDQLSTEPQRISSSFLGANNDDPQSVRSFYPTPRTSTKSSSSRVTQHIHVPPLPSIPQLKPHQVTINLSPPDIQRIVQNPSPLLPSQSRVIVTAKASVSDESGRPLNSTQLVTLPLPTIPASYDDYKEGDESFDPFYRDVPKIRNDRKAGGRFHWPTRELREKRSARTKRDSPTPSLKVLEDTTRIHEKLETTNPENVTELSGHSDRAPETEEIESSSSHPEGTNDQPEILHTDEATKSLRGHVDDHSQEHGNASDVTFNRKIFDEPDAQTSKDVDTRAIAHDTKFSNDRNNHYDNNAKKSANENSKSLESPATVLLDDQSSRFSLQLPEAVGPSSDAKSTRASSKKLHFENQSIEEEEEMRIEEKGKSEESHGDSEISEEEYFNDDYYYDGEMDSSSVRSAEDDSVEYSEEYSPNKIHSPRDQKSLNDEKVSKGEARSIEQEDGHRGEERKLKDESYQDDDEFAEASTARSSEEVTSYETSSNEYADTEQTSEDNSREIQDAEDEISGSRGETTKSDELDDSHQEVTSSTETPTPPRASLGDEDSDGVLKFTDEIPIVGEEMDEPDAAKRSGRPEAIPQDYIDDNYEPQSYKENGQQHSLTTGTGITAFFEELTTMQIDVKNLEEEEKEGTTTTESTTPAVHDSQNEKYSKEEKQSDEPDFEEKFHHENQVEKSIKEPNQPEEPAATATTTLSSVPMNISIPPTTTTSTPTPTTTTTSTMAPTRTTTRAMTTTTRPTSPKLFKPFTLRKRYVYSPPSTTPVPVVIKPRLALLNPKPAKPPKSYNDLAPKPVIRKTLFARKFPPTVRVTTPQSEDVASSTEMPLEKNRDTEKSRLDVSIVELPAETPSSSSAPTASTSEPDIKVKMEGNEIPTTTQIIQTSPTTDPEDLTPWPLLRMNQVSSTSPKAIGNVDQLAEVTTRHLDLENNDVPNVREPEIASTTFEPPIDMEIEKSTSPASVETSTGKSEEHEKYQIEPSSDSTISENNVAINEPKPEIPIVTTVEQVPTESTTKIGAFTTTWSPPNPPGQDSTTIESATLISVETSSRKPGGIKRIAFFNCLEKEMYRFYADGRDCRLFHYCSPGFTSRQVLDFRFVCEEGTAFDEESQSCLHDLNNPKCRKRVW